MGEDATIDLVSGCARSRTDQIAPQFCLGAFRLDIARLCLKIRELIAQAPSACGMTCELESKRGTKEYLEIQKDKVIIHE